MVQVKSIELDGKHPRICVPLTGTTNEEIIKQALAAETSDAEIIEWRADYYKKSIVYLMFWMYFLMFGPL